MCHAAHPTEVRRTGPTPCSVARPPGHRAPSHTPQDDDPAGADPERGTGRGALESARRLGYPPQRGSTPQHPDRMRGLPARLFRCCPPHPPAMRPQRDLPRVTDIVCLQFVGCPCSCRACALAVTPCPSPTALELLALWTRVAAHVPATASGITRSSRSQRRALPQ
jgi:hypothetical protein